MVFGRSVVIPLLSCWECQAEGVYQGAKRGEAGVDGLDVRKRDQAEPGQEQTRADIRLKEQSQAVEVMLPAVALVPGGMGLQRGAQARVRCGGLRCGGLRCGGG